MDKSLDAKTPKKKTFSEYYADPEFKRKHLERLRELVDCECGAHVTRSNMSRHKKSPRHLKKAESKEVQTNKKQAELEQRLKVLEEQLKNKIN